MPTLAAVIREFDPKKYRSVDVAKILGCRDEYVRVVWQRMDPKRMQLDSEKAYRRQTWKYHNDPEYRDNYLRRQREYKQRRKTAEARA